MATKKTETASKKDVKKSQKSSAENPVSGNKKQDEKADGSTLLAAKKKVSLGKKPALSKSTSKRSLVIKKGVARPKVNIPSPGKRPVELSSMAKQAKPDDGQLTAEELAKFKRDLLALRDKVFASVDAARQNVRHHNEDEKRFDGGTNTFDKFLAYERAGNTKDILTRIDEAITRINKGTYGKCLICGAPIRRVRLEVQPFSKHCIKCQEKLEKGEFDFRGSKADLQGFDSKE